MGQSGGLPLAGEGPGDTVRCPAGSGSESPAGHQKKQLSVLDGCFF